MTFPPSQASRVMNPAPTGKPLVAEARDFSRTIHAAQKPALNNKDTGTSCN